MVPRLWRIMGFKMQDCFSPRHWVWMATLSWILDDCSFPDTGMFVEYSSRVEYEYSSSVEYEYSSRIE